MATVLAGTAVAGHPEFSVSRVRCTAAPAGFEPPEVETCHALVVVSRGAFIRRAEGREVLVDSTTAYLSAPGTVEEFAHPVPGGDICTAIHLHPGLIASLAGGDPDLRLPTLPVDGASMLALHRITAAAAAGDPDGTLAEDVIRLVAALIARQRPDRADGGRPATAAARQRIVNQARAALAADPSLGLIALSQITGCSPHHLSRIFAQLTGSTVSQHRSRLRIGLALDRIARGEPDLARLAHDLGFADHAHLTRAIRAATGHPPSGCRKLLC